MCNYYAKLVPQYAYVAMLLYNILFKIKKSDCCADCDTAFKQLKHALVYTSILVILNFSANFVFETDGSDMPVGAVLMQHD